MSIQLLSLRASFPDSGAPGGHDLCNNAPGQYLEGILVHWKVLMPTLSETVHCSHLRTGCIAWGSARHPSKLEEMISETGYVLLGGCLTLLLRQVCLSYFFASSLSNLQASQLSTELFNVQH